ncbi:MAG: hypothetical protein ACJATV_000727 [Granulosicoccus sp.]|jgi:hypothetical protein
MFTSSAYITYIILSIVITIFVSRTLSKNGEIYLIEGFGGNIDLAKSVNHMLVVGFYLLNLGFVLLRMRTGVAIEDMEALIVYLSSGLGFVLLALGVAHFFNMFVIYTFRKSYMAKQQITNDLAALK